MSTRNKAVQKGCLPIKNPFGSKKHESLAEKNRLRLDDKVAIITGAASGIGAATARLFVSQGARVIIADVQAEAGRRLCSELGSSTQFFNCDVTKEADVAAAVDYAVERWGRLDIMFNNAGVPGPIVGLAELNMEEFDQVIAVHIKGAVLGVKHAARVMMPAGRGVILFSGSTSAKIGGAGPPLHSAANAAVLCIVRSAAAELVRHGIRVNAVSPHCVATPMSVATFNASMNPKKAITVEQFQKVLAASSGLDALTTEKVASAVLFLASDDAGFISGHNLVLDGGFSVTKQFVRSDLQAALQKSIEAERKNETQPSSKSPVQPPISSREEIGTSKLSTASTAREQEMKDKQRQERPSEKEVVASYEELRERERQAKEEEKKRKAEEEVALAKQEKARAKEDKARAKEAKALAEKGRAPTKDPKTEATDGGMHPIDKKALADEKRIQNENIELPNAGPEPDIPFEYRARTPVKTIGSLFGRGKEEQLKPPVKDNDDSSDPGNVSKKKTKSPAEEEITPASQTKQSPLKRIGDLLGLGTDSTSDKKENNSVGPTPRHLPKTPASPEIVPESQPKHSAVKRLGNLLGSGKDFTKEEEKEIKSTDPAKVSKKGKQEPNSPGKEEKAPPKPKDSPKTPASPEIVPESQPQHSPVKRLGNLLGLGKDSTKEDKNGNKSTDPAKVSKKGKQEPNSPANEEKHKDTPKTQASPEITTESQPKHSPVKRLGNLLGLGKDSTNEEEKEINSTDRGKVSNLKGKQEEHSADPRKEANSPAQQEKKARPQPKDSPKAAASQEITPEFQSKEPPMKKLSRLMSWGKDRKKKTVSWGKNVEKEDTTEVKSADARKVVKEEQKEEQSASYPVKVSTKETKSPVKEQKGRPRSKESSKTPISEPRPKQSPTVRGLWSWGVDPTKAKEESAINPGKVSKK